MKVTLVLVVISELGTIPNRLVNEMEDLEIKEQMDTIQTPEVLRLARILSRILKT